MSEDLTQKLPTSQDGMLAQILTTVQNLSTRMESLEQRFGSLEQKVEERLYDTRPIWEKVQADISLLQEGVQEMNTHWRDMNRKFSVFTDNLMQMQADYRDIYDRVRGLEGQRS
jgi:chromosome segregation ATPase